MSRAFTKERDDAPEPELVLPPRTQPNWITPQGLAALQRRTAATTDPAEKAGLERALEKAVVLGPPETKDRVAFGATVVVSGAADADRVFTIVGDDETDVRAGKISFTSPLAEALLDARKGQHVIWHRPAGDLKLTIRSIAYAETA
jgi:transcription elongation factor GreB